VYGSRANAQHRIASNVGNLCFLMEKLLYLDMREIARFPDVVYV
jgi:hypothetical protein